MASVHYSAFLNTLTMVTPFTCVPTAFKQRERHSHASPSKWPPFQSLFIIPKICQCCSSIKHSIWWRQIRSRI